MCYYGGKTVITYSWGNQLGKEFLALAEYDGTEEEFNAYVAKCKELALYDTGISAQYGDKLITLSTCEHSISNGRFVVVAKKVA